MALSMALFMVLSGSMAPIRDGEMVELLVACVSVRRLLVETKY